MDLHMIITISGIFIGMIILIYGIYSYEKLKKESKQSTIKNDKEDIYSDKSNEIKIEPIQKSSIKEETNSEDDIKGKNNMSEINDSKDSKKEESITEESTIKVSETEEIDLNTFDDTLVFDKNKEKPEKEIEDLFD